MPPVRDGTTSKGGAAGPNTGASKPGAAPSSSSKTPAITSCATPLQHIIKNYPDVFDSADLTGFPVAQIYDLDLFDRHLDSCKTAFGPTFMHCMAIKSSSISKLLRHAFEMHGFGVEGASLGEILQAKENCGIPCDKLVFDSPAKTIKELEYGMRNKIWTNLDNFEEYKRAKTIVDRQKVETGPIGFRINPLVGAGKIAALSVSTSDSKFGIPITEKNRLLKAYKESPWLNSVHVHVGSGGMGMIVLSAGIRVLADFAHEINKTVGRKQIKYLDIGGGLPANYGGDTFGADKVPTYVEYAAHLKEKVPELFSGEFQCVTEFGQSMFGKTGFLASRIEWMKGTIDKPIAIIHFGADCCVRQIYTSDHKRRLEAYKADGSAFPAGAKTKSTSVGGPLCFQGDFVAKDIALPSELSSNDIVVLKDGGSNTLSLFSRHCSRFCPPVYGYRWNSDGKTISEVVQLKARETPEQLYAFWGTLNGAGSSSGSCFAGLGKLCGL